MKDSRPSLLTSFLVGADICAVFLLWGSAATAYVNPLDWRWGEVVGLAFPLFLLGALLMTFLTLLLRPRKVWIPLAGLLLAGGSLRAYCPLHLPSPPPKGALKVVSYNVAGFWGGEAKAGPESIAAYLRQQAPDIVCLQEAYCIEDYLQQNFLRPLHDILPYMERVELGQNRLMCLSRYRIIDKRILAQSDDGKGSNGSAVFVVVTGEHDTLRVVNCHLQSNRLNPTDRQAFSESAHGDGDAAKRSGRHLVSKLSAAAAARSPQVALTAKYLRQHAGQRLIVCGDFNDHPLSYSRHALMATGLSDAYADTGIGPGRSFNRDRMYVRIDHLLYSPHFRAYDAHIDPRPDLSDHNPLSASFRLKEERR
jgi:endonuclease/exonuclease/phosphatase family metal-dependent hydrolase